MDKIDYSILTDDAEIKDCLKNQTHENIAENLYNLISDSNTSGLAIGLEGKWGSGKSTVIKILSKKLKENPDTFIFYIDTWAHEGDPLRRIFLESFLENVEELSELKKCKNKEKLKEIQSKIQYRKKTTVISKIPEVDKAGNVFMLK
ncbi:P-loop NTPase fold protein [uncultured Treponema sp.]|uniref:P-loop NTPase fold protein n=1 Tax=uncultured Treponema sp. TaxID=162155 RepID=UPI0026270BFC|nr:P-loop NTPase fold protein [uncultured Treponema sp.]